MLDVIAKGVPFLCIRSRMSKFRHKLNTGTLPKSNIKIVESDILPDFAFLILKTVVPNVVDGDPRTKLSIKMSIC
jgi:hypothetical protein